jgi:FKBP-type peptidyl-prolyl cis-trans isomerase (trigger factor)
MRVNKIAFVGEPRLEDIILEPDQDARYTFAYTPVPHVSIRDWRYLPFKPPLRKKYQDIDKQALSFITQEQALHDAYATHEIAANDWVLFEIILLNLKQTPLADALNEQVWIQISGEEAGEPFRLLFAGKKKGDQFISNHICLQEYLGNNLDIAYEFQITIKEVLPYAYFCFELFKEQFKLKSERKTQQKIIEIYSLRNDVSLRRAIVEDALALLARTYQFDIPEAAVLRQEKIVLDELQENPDYAVYKMQHNFEQEVWQLAHKQLREHMVADYFAYQENIAVADSDVYQYLNLTKRPRTKEFIYFMHPTLKANEEEEPIPHELLKLLCRKEKAINHLLHHWSKA